MHFPSNLYDARTILSLLHALFGTSLNVAFQDFKFSIFFFRFSFPRDTFKAPCLLKGKQGFFRYGWQFD